MMEGETDQMLSGRRLLLARKFADAMEEEKCEGMDCICILGMALGLFIEEMPDSHPGLWPLAEGIHDVAVMIFARFRAKRQFAEAKPEGNA